jgi:hypothetical protein
VDGPANRIPPNAKRRDRQRYIKLLRLVRMVGIFGVRAEQQDAAGDPFAHEGAALADPFAIAVVFDEALTEIGVAIGCRQSSSPTRASIASTNPCVGGAANRDRPRSAATTGRERFPIGRAINGRGQSRRNASPSGAEASNS